MRRHSTDSIIVRIIVQAEWDAIAKTEIETKLERAREREREDELDRKKRGHVAKRQFNPCQRWEKKR